MKILQTKRTRIDIGIRGWRCLLQKKWFGIRLTELTYRIYCIFVLGAFYIALEQPK